MIVYFFLILFLTTWGLILPTHDVTDTISVIGIILTSIVGLYYIVHHFKKKIVIVLIVAYLVRILILFLDYNGVPILHSGADTESFYKIAVSNMNNWSGQHYYLTNYTVFLTYLFKLIGPQRLFAQYINVILGIATMVYTYKCLVLTKVSHKATVIAMWILAFMPNQVIFSAILLREAIIISTFTISLYFLLKWIKKAGLSTMVLCVFFIVLSSVMHSGMLGITIGYLIVFATYDHRSSSIKFNQQLLIALPIILIFMVVLLQSGIATSYLNFLLNPDDMSSSEALLDRVTIESSDAGSAYLVGINSDSLPKLVLLLPLKVFYFLFSPMPWSWRGISDIIAFVLDSTVFIWLFWIIYRSKKRKLVSDTQLRDIVHIIMLCTWLSITMYALGTSTAGTAMRHRANFFPALLTCAMISINTRNTSRNKPIKDTPF